MSKAVLPVMLLLKWYRITTVFDTVGSRGKSAHDQANDVVDVDGKCIKNAITYFSHVTPVMLICDMYQAGQGLLYFLFRFSWQFR